MALIPCPECQKEVSTKAVACPQCALPFPGKSHHSTNSNSDQFSTCPDCGSHVSKKAETCHHCGLALQDAWIPQAILENTIEETWLCPHCGKPYTRQVKRQGDAVATPQEAVSSVIQPTNALQIAEKTTGEDYKDTDIESILEDIRTHSPLWQDDSASEGVSPSHYPGGSRSPLWQDLSARKDVASSQHHPDSRRRSIIVGLIIFLVVAISIGLGTIWKLQGINPLEALVSWLG
jgi:hypothetical protein